MPQFSLYRKRVQLMLLAGTPILPLITGLIGGLWGLKNLWSGQPQNFTDGFIDYAIPIGSGCFQIPIWPASVGIVALLMLIANKKVFNALFAVWLIAFITFTLLQLNDMTFAIFPIVDLTFILIVMLIARFSITHSKPTPPTNP